jgi:hypothetical protein
MFDQISTLKKRLVQKLGEIDVSYAKKMLVLLAFAIAL